MSLSTSVASRINPNCFLSFYFETKIRAINNHKKYCQSTHPRETKKKKTFVWSEWASCRANKKEKKRNQTTRKKLEEICNETHTSGTGERFCL